VRRDVAIQMALAFVLDVEGEDMTREVLPGRAAVDAAVAVFEDMTDTVFEVRDAIHVRVPKLHVVVAGFALGTVHCREMVLLDVGVVSPAAELVAVM
jgi:hypothetical protein